MEFVCIEAKAFMEMNEALEAVEKKMRETCGGGICSMDDWIDNQEACMLMNVSPRKLNLKYPELEKEENPYKILPDLFSDLPERQQGEGSLTDIVQYVAPATGYLQQSKVRNSLDFTTQHIARPHNLIDLEIYKRAIKLWLEKKARLNTWE